VFPEEIKDVQLGMGAGVAVMDELMTLPETFMWTKMGWESGVRLADILRQKEVERQAQGGLFLWGIGTTVSAERLRALRERVQVPHIVFTKMVSGSKPVDYEPDTAMAWRQYVDPATRQPQPLPTQYCEISRGGKARPSFCRRATPIPLDPTDLVVRVGDYRNLGAGHDRIGASQVTSILERRADAETAPGREYRVEFTAELVWPYVARLADPIAVPVGTVALRLPV